MNLALYLWHFIKSITVIGVLKQLGIKPAYTDLIWEITNIQETSQKHTVLINAALGNKTQNQNNIEISI